MTKKTCAEQDEKLDSLKKLYVSVIQARLYGWLTAPVSITIPSCFRLFGQLPGITLIKAVVERLILQQFVQRQFFVLLKISCISRLIIHLSYNVAKKST
jgi:hypothetical protein